jgi:LmbE family N-acetylglucosaminyl deacetylase
MANKLSIRLWARQHYLRRLQNTAVLLDDAELKRPSLIFAPHQDDETLGCGGTILQKQKLGAATKVVFMTNGSNSHPHFQHLLSKPQLVEIRRQEATAACQKLGIAAANIIFLGHEDTNLTATYNQACQQVKDILSQTQAEQIFIPYLHDPVPDHQATHQIVLAALTAINKPYTIYEYPIWFWHQWPFTNPLGTIRTGSRRKIMKATVANRFGTQLLQQFKYATFIQHEIDEKKAALNEHKTQVSQYIKNADWLTLGDVSEGEWLACFFQSHEFFHCYTYP